MNVIPVGSTVAISLGTHWTAGTVEAHEHDGIVVSIFVEGEFGWVTVKDHEIERDVRVLTGKAPQCTTCPAYTGETVFSRDGKRPARYANRTQAYRCMNDFVVMQNIPAVVIRRGRFFFVKILEVVH